MRCNPNPTGNARSGIIEMAKMAWSGDISSVPAAENF